MRHLVITTVLALSAVTLAGCSAGAGSSMDSPGPASMPSQDGAVTDRGGAELGYAPGDDTASVPGGSLIITTGTVTITVKTPSTAADEAARIVDRAGGNVAQRSERAPSEDDPGSAQLTVRIPSAQLTTTLDELKKLGTPRDTALNSTNVTAQSQDLDARITALQASVDRLLDLMTRATSTQDLITIESALSERQSNLESLEAQRRSLDDQVQLSTITLYLVSEKDTPAQTPNTFWTGLVAGWNAFLVFWSGVLVVVGVLVPWLAAAGIVTLIVLLIVRWATSRKPKPAAETPQQ